MARREYKIQLTVNNRRIHKVIIDPHYELKHSVTIDDNTVIALVKFLDGLKFQSIKQENGFEYFVEDKIKLSGKL